MSVVKINEAKDQFEDLISRAEAGETILIERDGRTIARIERIAVETAQPEAEKKFDWDALRKFTDSQPMQQESAGDFIRRMRDEDRY